MSAKSAHAVLKLLVVLVILGAGAAAYLFYSRPVAKVVKVGRGTAANVVPGSVMVDALRSSFITSEVDGKVLRSELELGKQVKEDEVLIQLDTGDIDLEIEREQAELDAAQASAKINVEIAKADAQTRQDGMDAQERDFKEGKIPELTMEQNRRSFLVESQKREKLVAEEKAHIATLENALKVAKRKRDKMTIKAPFDGTISEVIARKNDLVTAKQSVGTLIASARLVRAKISEEYFAAIQVGDKAKVSFLGYAGQAPIDAKVTQKLPAPEPDTQRYTVYLSVDLPPEKLLAGMTGDVGITVGEHANVVLVPRRAMWDGYVYVVENGRAFERKLTLDYTDYNQIEVKSGLKEGDLVIVEQLDKFSDGQHVRLEMAR